MKFIKSFLKFESVEYTDSKQNLSDILESLSVFETSLLDSINAEENDIEESFNYILDKGKSDIEEITNDVNFNEALSNLNLRKSIIQNSKDYETFLKNPIKFLPIYNISDNDLMNPIWLVIQLWDNIDNSFGEVKLFKVNDNIKKFYDKLSSKTIEISKGNDNWIYSTSNSGNNWELKNLDSENDTFKRYLYDEELREILKEKNYKVTI